ncbi:Hypothetical predicted protein [Cloeon dipterum]|uniref:Uncharacterized protein n=1 Tax=Cloeon dipterum TaxID=197152 RepID=A0A8S1DVW9_9INSE|nr:Hypothetical predicted protein [Cloeon dipterum]
MDSQLQRESPYFQWSPNIVFPSVPTLRLVLMQLIILINPSDRRELRFALCELHQPFKSTCSQKTELWKNLGGFLLMKLPELRSRRASPR